MKRKNQEQESLSIDGLRILLGHGSNWFAGGFVEFVPVDFQEGEFGHETSMLAVNCQPI